MIKSNCYWGMSMCVNICTFVLSQYLMKVPLLTLFQDHEHSAILQGLKEILCVYSCPVLIQDKSCLGGYLKCIFGLGIRTQISL